MSSDDHVRSSHYSPNRKNAASKSHGYSPSANYNYGNTGAHGNSSHGSHGNTSGGNKQFHRKPGSFKRDSHGGTDKLIKQNDTIIHLLKEIRDRLPELDISSKNTDDPVEVLADDEMEIESTTNDNQCDSDQEEILETEVDESDQNREYDMSQDQSAYEMSDDEALDSKVNGNI